MYGFFLRSGGEQAGRSFASGFAGLDAGFDRPQGRRTRVRHGHTRHACSQTRGRAGREFLPPHLSSHFKSSFAKSIVHFFFPLYFCSDQAACPRAEDHEPDHVPPPSPRSDKASALLRVVCLGERGLAAGSNSEHSLSGIQDSFILRLNINQLMVNGSNNGQFEGRSLCQ